MYNDVQKFCNARCQLLDCMRLRFKQGGAGCYSGLAYYNTDPYSHQLVRLSDLFTTNLTEAISNFKK